MKKKKLLIVCPAYTTLIQKDADLFSGEYEVRIFDLQVYKKGLLPFHFIKEFFFLLRHIFSTEIMVSRFVGYQTVLPILLGKIFGKPVVCIMGGLECYSFPSIRLGSYTRPFFGAVTKWCLRNATHLCPVHDSLVLSDYTYQDEDYPKQGFLYFVPGCKTPYTVIRNGYDASAWRRTKEKIPNTFITVANEIEKDHIWRLKGIDLIISVAPDFPDCTFTIVGGKKDFNANAPANVSFTGEVKNERLHELLSQQEFYLQLSIIEGFPNALCEAMLCECIPVGSNVAAIPEIIGSRDRILMKRDAAMLRPLLSNALKLDRIKEGKNARKRIEENYTIEKRKDLFLNLFSKLAAKNI